MKPYRAITRDQKKILAAERPPGLVVLVWPDETTKKRQADGVGPHRTRTGRSSGAFNRFRNAPEEAFDQTNTTARNTTGEKGPGHLVSKTLGFPG